MREDTAERMRGSYRFRSNRFRARYHGVDDDGVEERSAQFQRLRRELLDAERQAVVALRNEGTITEEVMQRVQRDIDLEDSRLDRLGTARARARGCGPRLICVTSPTAKRQSSPDGAERPAVAAEPGAHRAGAPGGERRRRTCARRRSSRRRRRRARAPKISAVSATVGGTVATQSSP